MDVETALAELSEAMTAAGIPLWQAPESLEALAALEAELALLRLPDDVRRFWTLVEPATLRAQPDPRFVSPAAALQFWRQDRDDFDPANTLLTVGYESRLCMSVDLAQSGGGLLEWDVTDPDEPTRRFNDLPSWIVYVAELLRRGLYERIEAPDGPVWTVPGYGNMEAERALRVMLD